MGETTTDSMVLAAAVPRLPAGSLAFELGSGCGDVIREVLPRCRGSLWIGIDTRAEALRSSAGGGRSGCPEEGYIPLCGRAEDVRSLFPAGCADLVIMNPPYNVDGACRPSPDPGRRSSRAGGSMLLHVFLRAASHLLRRGGRLIAVGRPGSLCRMMTGCAAMDLHVEYVMPVGSAGSPAVLVLVGAVKSEEKAMSLLASREPREVSAVSGEDLLPWR